MASVGPTPEIKLLYDHAAAAELITCFDVAAVTMFLYDYFLTLGMEVDLVWSSNWGPMKILFVIQRYLPFIDAVALCLLHQLSTTINPRLCRLIENMQGVLVVTGFCVSELILTIRAWAVWKRNKRLGITLSMFFFAIAVASYVVVGLALHSIKLSDRPYPGFQGCLVTGSNRLSYLNWLLLMMYEAVLLVLMIIPGIAAYREGGNKGLYSVVYRDGVVFYAYLFVLSTINVIVIKVFPANYLFALSSVERCLHSVLTSRVLLHIRDYMQKNTLTLQSHGITDIQFASGVIGRSESTAEAITTVWCEVSGKTLP